MLLMAEYQQHKPIHVYVHIHLSISSYFVTCPDIECR